MMMLVPGGRAGEIEGPVNLLDKTETFSIQAPPGAQIEVTPSGGLKVTYSIVEPPGKPLWLSLKRVFKPAVDGTAVVVDVPGFSKEILLNVWNESKNRAFKPLDARENPVVDLFGLHYRGSKEPFNGMVHAVEIAMEVPKYPGEHVIEIERFILDR